MTSEIIAGTTKGSLSAVLITSKAFVIAHPVGMAFTGGALLGIGGYVSFKKYLSNRKEKRELMKQTLAATAQAS